MKSVFNLIVCAIFLFCLFCTMFAWAGEQIAMQHMQDAINYTDQARSLCQQACDADNLDDAQGYAQKAMDAAQNASIAANAALSELQDK